MRRLIRSPLLSLPALVLLLVLAHGVTLVVPFQFDDIHQIEDNPLLRDPSNLGRVFYDPWMGSSTGHGFYYRPLLFVTFIFDGWIGDGAPLPYRITSLLLLLGYALLAGCFARAVLPHLWPGIEPETADRAGWLTALLVASHPLLSESVLMATSRSTLLMAFFAIAALTGLADRDGTPGGELGVLVLAFLALLTKETAVVMGLLAPLVAWISNADRSWRVRIAAGWPVLVPVVVYVGAHFLIEAAGGWPVSPTGDLPDSIERNVPLSARPAQGWMALAGFARLLIFPAGTSPSHLVPIPGGFARALTWIAWAAVLGAGAWLVFRGARLGRLLGALILWFVLSLAPTLLAGLNTPLGEHRSVLAVALPLAALGFLIAVQWRRAWVRYAAAALLLLLAASSALQSLPWRSRVALWEHETARDPRDARAWSFLADAYRREGERARAMEAIQRALAIRPGHLVFLSQAAGLEMEAGRLEEAGRYIRLGLEIDTGYLPLLLQETERASRLGRLDEALRAARGAVEVSPRSSVAWNALGNVLYLSGDPQAVGAYRRAVETDPGNVEARINLEMAGKRWGIGD